jgi:hypothetical protein
MKKKLLVALLLFTQSTISFSQTAISSPTPKHRYNRPNLIHINLRLHQQFMELQAALKAGKITVEQSNTLIANIKQINQQKKDSYKKENKDDLTSDSVTQLDQSLDESEQNLTASGVPYISPTSNN